MKFFRVCPVCERFSLFFSPFGCDQREDARCIFCGALERHRFLWTFLKLTDLFDGKEKKVLHVAPEFCFERRFKKQLGKNYLTADLCDPRVMIQMDITNIRYPSETFDVILCSHVLEHVENDKQAMREIARVLDRNGWAILLVPITVEKTFEDFSITTPEERTRVFGQHDHVRRYGKDYIDRLREAGFKVREIKVQDIFSFDDAQILGLTPASGEIYFCTH